MLYYCKRNYKVVVLARRTILEQITLYENERDRLEGKISEQEAFDSLSSQGDYGAETSFTDVTKLHKRLSSIADKLETLYRQEGL